MEWLSVEDYFKLPESMRRMELVYGVAREPPAPRYGHQFVVTHLGALLDAHVREHRLGQVCLAPVDVVLDEAAALVVQPDIIVIRQDRLQIIRDRVWGPPDLTVEILSPSTAIWDRTTKVGWYRQYGVAECWLVDTRKHSIEVVDLKSDTRKTFVGDETIQSTVLAHWAVPAEQIFL